MNDRDPVVALQNFWPAGLRCPIVFCDMVGEEGETPGLSEDEEDKKTEPSSKCNLEEAKKAVSCYVKCFIQIVTISHFVFIGSNYTSIATKAAR